MKFIETYIYMYNVGMYVHREGGTHINNNDLHE